MQLPSTPAQKTRNSRPIEIPTPDEICALIRACSARAPTGLRNRALLVLGWRGGLRLGEALNLYPRDLDPDAGTVNVRRGKGGKQRTIGLDPTAFAVLEHWAERRRSLSLNGKQPLICTLQGRGLLPSYVRGLMPRLARKIGLEKRAHYHALRHAHASELARERVPINQIQMQLGHTNLSTTDTYLSRIAPQEVIETMQSRNWSF